MRTHISIVAASLCLALFCGNVTFAQVRVEADKENVVASKIEGQWKIDAELTKRLEGHAHGEVSFKSDPAVAAKIPAKYEKFLDGKRVYLAGVMVWKNEQHPFILITHKGNPHLIYFRARDGDPFGDAESFNVMLAAGKDKKNDLLFIGGDFNNQPFAAFRRVPAADE